MAKVTFSARQDDPQLDAMLKTDAELKAERARLEQHLEAVVEGLASAKTPKSLLAAADELLADGIGAMPNVDQVVLAQQQDVITSKLRIVNLAIAKNATRINEARAANTRQITEAAKPEYVGIVRKVRDAVKSLQSTLADEVRFRDRLESASGSMSCGVIRPMGLDNLQHYFDGWLAEAKTYYGI